MSDNEPTYLRGYATAGAQPGHWIAVAGGPWGDWPRWFREGPPPDDIAVRTGPPRGRYVRSGRTDDGRALRYVWQPEP